MIKRKKIFFIGVSLILAFLLWTLLLCIVDVQEIGPQGSSVGFATLNGFVHKCVGVNIALYTLTDWLSLLPIGVAFGFSILGLVQWIKRKSLIKVDYSILLLGGFYIIVMLVYILFELLFINYRPVLINGYLEVSYPSSTTMLVMCIIPTAMMQFDTRIRNKTFRKLVLFLLAAFTIFMVLGRLAAGVHWITDIIGGALFSAGITLIYYSINDFKVAQD